MFLLNWDIPAPVQYQLAVDDSAWTLLTTNPVKLTTVVMLMRTLLAAQISWEVMYAYELRNVWANGSSLLLLSSHYKTCWNADMNKNHLLPNQKADIHFLLLVA